MSVYISGAEAFRDTTKWLVALVPIAAIVVAGGVIGPRLLSNAASVDSPLAWVRSNTWPLVGIATVVVGVLLVVSFGATVLSTQASNFTPLLTTDEEKLSSAFRAGVGAPYFLDDGEFRRAIARLDAKWSAGTAVTESELARAVAATDMLRAWALHDALTTSFKRFRIWFGVGVALIVAGFVVATLALQPPAGIIGEPKVVDIAVRQAGAEDLLNSTDCSEPTETEFVAVAGTWTAPVLEADGPGCRFRARWRPDPNVIELRLPPDD